MGAAVLTDCRERRPGTYNAATIEKQLEAACIPIKSAEGGNHRPRVIRGKIEGQCSYTLYVTRKRFAYAVNPSNPDFVFEESILFEVLKQYL